MGASHEPLRGIASLASFLAHIPGAVRRLIRLLVVVIPPFLVLGVVVWLEFLSAVQRVLCIYSRPKSKKGATKSRPLTWLTSPAEPGDWLSFWSASILTVRLHANIPLVALFARWAILHRPDLATIPFVLRILAGLREEETFGPGGHTGNRMPADERALEHVHARLTGALGVNWTKAMRLDPVAISSDCVVETYSAVLREDVLDASRQARRSSSSTSRVGRLLWPCARRRKMDSVQAPPIAEAEEARRAVVRVRRKGVFEAATVDLRLVRWLLIVLERSGLCRLQCLDTFEDFARFVAEQLDLRNEAKLLRLCHAALPRGMEDARLTFPRIYSEGSMEVLILSFEEGICMGEVLRRRPTHMADDVDTAARSQVARELTRAFWMAALDHGLILGGLAAGSLLLRSAGNGNDMEAVSLRCGLTLKIDERMQDDLRDFAGCLAEGPEDVLAPFLLERVHVPAGGELRTVRDAGAFSSGVCELVKLAKTPALGAQLVPRGPALLQRALALAEKHNICIGREHLQVAAGMAALHGICCRLDPVAAGKILQEMQAVAG